MKIGSLRGLLTVPYIIGIAGYLKTANVFNDIYSVSPPPQQDTLIVVAS